MGANNDDSKANYHRPESKDISSYNVGFDMETGTFGGGHIIYGYKRIDTDLHPDSGVEASGVIENWKEIKEMLVEMSLRIGPLEYLGYDLGMTTKVPSSWKSTPIPVANICRCFVHTARMSPQQLLHEEA